MDFKTILKKSKKYSQEDFLSLLRKYDEEYHSSGNSSLTDEEYDTLTDLYKVRFNEVYDEIGGIVKIKEKVKLPVFMASLAKVKDEESLDKWIKKYPEKKKGNSYLITNKIDGVSVLIEYDKKTKGSKMYTRGRKGIYGGNITHFIPYLNIPSYDSIGEFGNPDYGADTLTPRTGRSPTKSDEPNLIIRGELVISKKKFKKYSDKMVNARNMMSGLINSKTIGKSEIEALEDVDLIAYNIYNTGHSQDRLMEMLDEFKFKTPNPVLAKSIHFADLQEHLAIEKEKYKYEIDGLVIYYLDKPKLIEIPTDRNPRHVIAFKQNTTAVATVIKVEWEVSRLKLLKPVVHINPIFLSGATIVKLTGHNARFIKDNNIGEGAEILIMRSGEVIPTIVECIKPASHVELPDGEWNENKVELLATSSDYDDKIEKKRILHYFEALDIKFMAEQTISKIYDAGYKTLFDVLCLTEDELYKIDGFKEKSVLRIMNAIQQATTDQEIHCIMHASGIFPTLGSKKCKLIVDAYPNFLEDNANSEEWEKRVRKIRGFKETASIFANNVDLFKEFMRKHPIKLREIITEDTILDFVEDGKESIRDKIVVFTGIRDKELEKKISIMGGKITTGISGKTNILIVKEFDKEDTDNMSSKLKKALEKGIEILTIEQFKAKYV